MILLHSFLMFWVVVITTNFTVKSRTCKLNISLLRHWLKCFVRNTHLAYFNSFCCAWVLVHTNDSCQQMYSVQSFQPSWISLYFICIYIFWQARTTLGHPLSFHIWTIDDKNKLLNKPKYVSKLNRNEEKGSQSTNTYELKAFKQCKK